MKTFTKHKKKSSANREKRPFIRDWEDGFILSMIVLITIAVIYVGSLPQTWSDDDLMVAQDATQTVNKVVVQAEKR